MASLLPHKQVSLRKLVWVAPLVIIATIIANLIVRTISVTFLGVPETFQYLQVTTVVGSTVIYLLMALLAFVLVSRFAQRPIQFYLRLAFVFLCVSLLSPIMALLGLLSIPYMSLPIFWTMIMMHIISAIIAVGLLTTLTRVQQM